MEEHSQDANELERSRQADARFERLRKAVLHAAGLPLEQRAQYLRTELDDEQLVADALSLLDVDLSRADRLVAGAVTPLLVDALGADRTGVVVGDALGPYRLQSVLGRGGMGIVFLAHQQTPIERYVALKLLTGGAGVPFVLRRFELEQRVLGQLDHPNIARVLDASETSNGHPYFVMEYVRGESISEYCAKHEYSLRERLVVFLQVCRAVDHAHRRGIVHRDLKPSNILVAEQDGRPLVKIIDFGIARAIEESSAHLSLATIDGHVIGTPQYMSPEQARGERDRVDTRADIYSLGVVLHELVTGVLPYELQTTSLLEVLRVVAQDPPTLSRSSVDGQRLPADLRNVLSMALEGELDRRYGSVRLLIDDIEAFLDRRPVVARRPSTFYHLRKAAERHPFGATVLMLLVIVAVGSAIAMSLLYRGQVRASSVAREEAEKATAVGAYLEDVLSSADPTKGGPDQTIGELLSGAVTTAENELASRPGVQAVVLRTLGSALNSIERYEESRHALDGARSAAHRAERDDPVETARLELAFAALESRNGHLELAVGHARAGLESLRRSGSESAELELELLERETWNLRRSNRFAESDSVSLFAIARSEAAFGRESAPYARALASRGVHYDGPPEEAALLLEEALQIQEKVLGPKSLELVNTMNLLALVLGRAGENDRADAVYQEAFQRAEEGFPPNHGTIAIVAHNFASHLLSTRRFEEALPYQMRAQEIWEHNLESPHPYFVVAANNIAYMKMNLCRFDEAIAGFRVALAMADSLPSMEAGNHAMTLINFGQALHGAGRLREAGQVYRRAIEFLEQAKVPGYWELNYAHRSLAVLLLDQGKPAEAEELLREVLDRVVENARPWFQMPYARALAMQGREEDAKSTLLRLRDVPLQPTGDFTGLAEFGRCAELLRGWGEEDLAQQFEAVVQTSPCAEATGPSGR